MLVKIADRREILTQLEKQLQTLDRTRAAKKDELRQLERKLVRVCGLRVDCVWAVLGVACCLCGRPSQRPFVRASSGALLSSRHSISCGD
jgi:hypothetical protein